jgi:hypothetical protein
MAGSSCLPSRNSAMAGQKNHLFLISSARQTVTLFCYTSKVVAKYKSSYYLIKSTYISVCFSEYPEAEFSLALILLIFIWKI